MKKIFELIGNKRTLLNSILRRKINWILGSLALEILMFSTRTGEG